MPRIQLPISKRPFAPISGKRMIEDNPRVIEAGLAFLKERAMTKHQQPNRAHRVFAASNRGTDNDCFINRWIIECRTCGFEPDDQWSLPRTRCPKCHATTWRRVPRPGSLLAVSMADAKRVPPTKALRQRHIHAQRVA